MQLPKLGHIPAKSAPFILWLRICHILWKIMLGCCRSGLKIESKPGEKNIVFWCIANFESSLYELSSQTFRVMTMKSIAKQFQPGHMITQGPHPHSQRLIFAIAPISPRSFPTPRARPRHRRVAAAGVWRNRRECGVWLLKK